MEKKGEKIVFVHSQVLRIREEDLHIGEDIKERSPPTARVNDEIIETKGCRGFNQRLGHLASRIDVVLIASRPILPCSPLSGKTAVKASS